MTGVSLSLVVLTYNEAENLEHCLRSAAGLVGEIFIVDSGSTDGTQQIGREFSAHIVEHPFENQAQQFNWALDNLPIDTEWILKLDADEYLLPELRQEIMRLLPTLEPDVSGLYMKRRVIFQDRWIRHGGYYPTWLLRLFRAGRVRSESILMDEHLIVLEGETRKLRHDFVDHNRKGLEYWILKHEAFAKREAQALLQRAEGENGRLRGRLLGSQPERRRWLKTNLFYRAPLFLRSFLYFVYRYFLRLGFLDGREGLVFHVLQGFWYRFLVDAQLAESRRRLRGRPL